jgi:hypothetical protein
MELLFQCRNNRVIRFLEAVDYRYIAAPIFVKSDFSGVQGFPGHLDFEESRCSSPSPGDIWESIADLSRADGADSALPKIAHDLRLILVNSASVPASDCHA